MNLSRRLVLQSAAALPLAAVLADPRLAAAAATGLESVSIKTAKGRGVTAALARPAKLPAPGIVLIHEWWGLNDQIKTMGAELAKVGYLALCVDLYGGKTTADPDEAAKLMGAADRDATTDSMSAWINWLRARKDCTGKVATLGWCFGGGVSLAASLAASVDATVIYYGSVTQPATQLGQLKGPVLGHFATRDGYITPAMVDGFEREMAKAKKPLLLYRYDADHAFANPTGNHYQAKEAQLAWTRTLEFLKSALG